MLGVKTYDGEFVTARQHLVRRRGASRIHPGQNVGMGKDHTLFAKIDGFVSFSRKGRDDKIVWVLPGVPDMVAEAAGAVPGRQGLASFRITWGDERRETPAAFHALRDGRSEV